MVFNICEGISWASFSVKELDVIVHKKTISLKNPIEFLATLYPTSQAKMVVGVRTRHNHQILFELTLWLFLNTHIHIHIYIFYCV